MYFSRVPAVTQRRRGADVCILFDNSTNCSVKLAMLELMCVCVCVCVYMPVRENIKSVADETTTAAAATMLYTLKNKAASWCHRRTFLSKWFNKEPLTSEEPFCFTKASLWWKKVLQNIKRCSLTEWFFVEPKLVLLWHRCEPFKHLYFCECTDPSTQPDRQTL